MMRQVAFMRQKTFVSQITQMGEITPVRQITRMGASMQNGSAAGRMFPGGMPMADGSPDAIETEAGQQANRKQPDGWGWYARFRIHFVLVMVLVLMIRCSPVLLAQGQAVRLPRQAM